MNKLTTYSIKEIHKAYSDKLLTPTSFVDLCLEKAKLTSGLNAFVTITEDLAETHSIESEKRHYIDKKTKPLDGITIGMKDNFCTKSVPTTCASNMLKNFIPTYDATVYSRLRAAGACLIGKCNLDEFAMGSGTVDSIFGPTRNPWAFYKGDKGWRIAGGSSGGSAVAVSSGACVAAIGSDTGKINLHLKIVNFEATGRSELQSYPEKKPKKLKAAVITETLSRLNLSIDALPEQHQQLLHNLSGSQAALDIDQLDPIAVSVQQTNGLSQQLTEEYEVLELRQKNQVLQREIDANRRFLDRLRRDLEWSKESLVRQSPNAENIQDSVRQMKQKLASYDEIYEKAKLKFSKLGVPQGALPAPLAELAGRLARLQADEARLRLRADDVTLARRARRTLSRLRK